MKRPSVISRRRPTGWQALVPVVALLAGLLGATTARAARGTDLRSARSTLVDQIRQAESKGASDDKRVASLQSSVAALTGGLAQSDAGITAITAGASGLRVPAGLVAMTGPGVSLTLDDAHLAVPATDPLAANASVVRRSDMQAAVNAFWAGGAEAIMVMDQRLVATSAIRCVGNTLLLNGRVYSPPFSIVGIGPAGSIRAALQQSTGLQQYRKDAATYGLGYDLASKDKVTVPAYQARIALSYAAAGS